MTEDRETTPDPREALRKEVAHVLMRAGYGSEAAAFDVADDIILTVQHPGLRWDIDDDHLTPAHRTALAQAAPPPQACDVCARHPGWQHFSWHEDNAVPPSGLDVVLLAVEELDNCWSDQGDHIEWDSDALPERLIELRRAYAALTPEPTEPEA